MHGQPLEVDAQRRHGEWDTGTPKHIARDDSPQRMVRVWQDARDETAGGGCDDWGDDGEKPDGGHGGEGDLVDVHTRRDLSYITLKDVCRVDG